MNGHDEGKIAMSSHSRQHHNPIILGQILNRDPILKNLLARAELSENLLKSILPLIPPVLRKQIRAGPLDGTVWHILVPHAAAATRLRYCAAALEAHLRAQGHDIREIRIQVLPQ